MKKDKKKYTKPVVKKNEPLVNITFASVATSGTATAYGTGGTPAPAFG